MKLRQGWLVPAVLSALALSSGAALAQDTKFQFGGGVQFPLNQETFLVEQTLGFHVRAEWHAAKRLSIGVVYEDLSSEDKIERLESFKPPQAGDVKVKLYGVTAKLHLNGEPTLQLYATFGAGRGSVDWSNPYPRSEDPAQDALSQLPGKTNLKVWYEVGVGVQSAVSRHFGGQFQVTLRRLDPDRDDVPIIPQARSTIVPSLSVFARF